MYVTNSETKHKYIKRKKIFCNFDVVYLFIFFFLSQSPLAPLSQSPPSKLTKTVLLAVKKKTRKQTLRIENRISRKTE